MSLKITLFQNTKLSNKYHEVFKDQTTLATYLGTCPHLDVYSGDDIYFTNNGSISIDNSTLVGHVGDKYNYMQFTQTFANGTILKRYAFVNDITIVNEVCVINYTEDVWHTYAIKNDYSTDGINFDIKNSLLYQTKSLTAYTGSSYTQAQLNALPKALPCELEGQNAPKFRQTGITPELNYETSCYILVVASMYKTASAGVVNKRYISNYLLSYKQKITGAYTPASTLKEYDWPLTNETLEFVQKIMAQSSDTKVRNKIIDDPDWYYEIIDIKLIPYTIGYALFNSVLSADATHDAGLHEDFTPEENMIGEATDGTYQYFTTECGFNNLIEDDSYKYVSGSTERWTYNGFKAYSQLITSKTISSDYKYIAIGNMSRIIPLTFNGQTKTAKFQITINKFDNNVLLLFDNTITDISTDLTLAIPISCQSADITQQQKIGIKTQNSVAMIGMVGTAIQTGLSMGASFVGGMKGIAGATTSAQLDYAGSQAGINIASSGTSGILSLISSAIQLDARNQAQYLTNKVVSQNEVAVMNACLGILREIEMDYANSDLVSTLLTKYGYIYTFIMDTIKYVYTSGNYFKFTQVNVYGYFSQSIARDIETILENGVILN